MMRSTQPHTYLQRRRGLPNLRPQVTETPTRTSFASGLEPAASERQRLNFEQRRLEYTRQRWRSQGSGW